MLVGIFFILSKKRADHLRERSSVSQYQASVRLMPLVSFSPSACTSVMKSMRPAIFIDLVTPNCCAALMAPMVSPPPLARPSTCAFEACACSRNDEKSVADSGCRTLPTTLPPLASTTCVVSFSSESPKA
ncbi:hypothetical protein D3C71_1831850 [compost metagenome]